LIIRGIVTALMDLHARVDVGSPAVRAVNCGDQKKPQG